MAGGRGVDSDASGSGLRGGRGRGCSTRGRGRTIPPLPPPYSGTHGASSFAQHPVPPPLPSIPSSSTPFPRPVDSSPASQSPTAPASSEPRNKLSLVVRQMQKLGKKQQCVSQEIWESWQQAWEDPAFKRKCAIFARNRRNETGSDRAGPSRHTGGSIFAINTSQLLMSDQHSAGTSSSDPPPATDPHVSTALHQPLSSPLDLDTIDNTLVTPADSMTHPEDTPVDTTTMDPAED
ncbi:hypothetical protein JCGZ_26460 [Jatropha curcas]|uniref:Uncharacterized protein n=1 Tax=Jatropha curcas TaxID=180498 RepID=A0A067JLA6_JATCU|nr:hypothetical protein JCGZ_26460 [Jatropha curcas]